MLAHSRAARTTAIELNVPGPWKKPAFLPAQPLHHRLRQLAVEQFDERIDRGLPGTLESDIRGAARHPPVYRAAIIPNRFFAKVVGRIAMAGRACGLQRGSLRNLKRINA